ncbi:MAG: hypothetical protein LBR65_02845 [Culturomica sp.]|nr:hypothetical protein [Culturomica sp.]
MDSKIALFFLTIAYLLLNLGCGDKNTGKLGGDHIVPYVPIGNAAITIGGGGEAPWVNGSRYFTHSNTGNPLGYRGHGVVIYTSNGDNFTCFDATCTACSSLTSHFTQANLEGLIAICPVCETEYELYTGQPAKTEQKIYPLRPYSVSKSNNRLIITN